MNLPGVVRRSGNAFSPVDQSHDSYPVQESNAQSLVKVSPGVSQLSKLVESIQSVQMLVSGLDFSRKIRMKKEKYDLLGLTIGDSLKSGA